MLSEHIAHAFDIIVATAFTLSLQFLLQTLFPSNLQMRRVAQYIEMIRIPHTYKSWYAYCKSL